MGSSSVHGPTSPLLRRESTLGIDLTFELGQKRRLPLDRCLLRPMLGMHLVGSSAGTKSALTRRHRSVTMRLGRLRHITRSFHTRNLVRRSKRLEAGDGSRALLLFCSCFQSSNRSVEAIRVISS
jgi:hypothetical protein